jgi:hypothetical protein
MGRRGLLACLVVTVTHLVWRPIVLAMLAMTGMAVMLIHGGRLPHLVRLVPHRILVLDNAVVFLVRV